MSIPITIYDEQIRTLCLKLWIVRTYMFSQLGKPLQRNWRALTFNTKIRTIWASVFYFFIIFDRSAEFQSNKVHFNRNTLTKHLLTSNVALYFVNWWFKSTVPTFCVEGRPKSLDFSNFRFQSLKTNCVRVARTCLFW